MLQSTPIAKDGRVGVGGVVLRSRGRRAANRNLVGFGYSSIVGVAGRRANRLV
ncbi:MAG: hypothetical protein ABIZ82_08290 [Candidatus Tumulicola sp.]